MVQCLVYRVYVVRRVRMCSLLRNKCCIKHVISVNIRIKLGLLSDQKDPWEHKTM